MPPIRRLSVAVAALCLAVPLFAQQLRFGNPQPISVPRLGMAGAHTSDPVIGSNGSSFLVAWADDRGSSHTVATRGKVMRVGADGVPLDSVALATQLGPPVGVVWTGTDWIVAGWGGVARISADGELIATRPSTEWSSMERRFTPYGLAWAGDAAVFIGVVHPYEGGYGIGVRAVTFDRDLNITAIQQLTDLAAQPLGIAGDGDSAMVVYREIVLNDVRAAAFGRDGLLRKQALIAQKRQLHSGAMGATPKGYVLTYAVATFTSSTQESMWIDHDLHVRGVRPLDLTDVLTRAPSLVWDGLVLTAYVTTSVSATKSKLVAVRFTETGALLKPAVETVADLNVAGPLIAAAGAGGTTLLGHLTIPQGTSGTSALKLRAFGPPSAFKTAPEVAVEHGAPMQELFSTATGESGSVVAWHERPAPYGPRSIYATRLDRNAKVLDPDSLLLGSSSCAEIAPAVATNGRDSLVAWYDDHQVAVASVRTDGTFGKTHAVTNLAVPCDKRPLRLTSNGTDYLLVWRIHDAAADKWRLVGLRLRADGSAIDAAPFPIANVFVDEAYALRVASNGQDYLVAWDYKAVRVTSDGVVLDRNPSFIQLGAGSLGELWWNGTSYVAQMYADYTGTRFVRIGSDGTGGRSRTGPQPDVTPWPNIAYGTEFPTDMRCNAGGCVGAMVDSEDYGTSVVSLLRMLDDGTNITLSVQPSDFTYHDADDEYGTHPTAVIPSNRMAVVYLARPTARPYSNARTLFVATEVVPRTRAVRH